MPAAAAAAVTATPHAALMPKMDIFLPSSVLCRCGSELCPPTRERKAISFFIMEQQKRLIWGLTYT
jgi:hypothetical protein